MTAHNKNCHIATDIVFSDKGNQIMKNKIFMGSVLALTLVANSAFAMGVEMPTAGSSFKEGCETYLPALTENEKRESAKDVHNEKKKEDVAGRIQKAAPVAAAAAVSVLSEMESIRSSIRSAMKGIAESFKSEIEKVNAANAPDILDYYARSDIRQGYRASLFQGMFKGLQEAGFDAISQINPDSNVQEIVIKGKGPDTKAVLILDMDDQSGAVKVQYDASVLRDDLNLYDAYEDAIPWDRIVVRSEDIFGSDDFEASIVSRAMGSNIGLNSGTYGRAGILSGDSHKVMTSKLAARFIPLALESVSSRQYLQDVRKELGQVKSFCADQKYGLK